MRFQKPIIIATATLSSLSLFFVEPLAGKALLPFYGGTAAVWTAAMSFFTLALLVGYAYAALLVRLVPTWSGTIHAAVAAAGIGMLSVVDYDILPTTSVTEPSLAIPMTLSIMIGIPFVLLSAHATLLQWWAARAGAGISWGLYRWNNIGSFAGLLAFPLLLEPFVQTGILWETWRILTIVLLAVTAGIGLWVVPRSRHDTAALPAGPDYRSPRDVVLWITYPAVAALLLLGTTTVLTQVLFPMPLLWVIPLGVYLASFVVAWNDRPAPSWLPAAAGCAGGAYLGIVVDVPSLAGIGMVYGIFIVATLAVSTWALHRATYRCRPAASSLGTFYLAVAAGGALAAAFANILAPAVFDGFTEYPLALAATVALLLTAIARENGVTGSRPHIVATAGFLLLAIIAFHPLRRIEGTAVSDRNFYGVRTVITRTVSATDGTTAQVHLLIHSGTVHGFAYMDGPYRAMPTSYYARTTPVGPVMTALQDRLHALRVGVIGMGTGTMAAYARPGDTTVFFEIDPAMTAAAWRDFPFLTSSAGTTEVITGDGRLALAQWAADGRQPFDILVVDAFSGDMIPAHLLTREAIATYRRAMTDDGLLAIHVSHRQLSFDRLLRGLAADAGLTFAMVAGNPPSGDPFGYAASWGFIGTSAALERAGLAPQEQLVAGDMLWTDQFTPLVPLVR